MKTNIKQMSQYEWLLLIILSIDGRAVQVMSGVLNRKASLQL
jgi:hypothetical protein